MTKPFHILAIFKNEPMFLELISLLEEEGFKVELQSSISLTNIKLSKFIIVIIDEEFFHNISKKKEFQKVDLSNFFLITNSLKKLENFENLTVLKKPFYFDTFLEKVTNKIRVSESSVKKIQFGELYFSPKKMGLFDKKKRKKVSFTELENKFINFLLKEKNGSSKVEILSNVWGHNAELQTHTLESLIYRLRRKIEKNPNKPKFILQVKKKYFIKHN